MNINTVINAIAIAVYTLSYLQLHGSRLSSPFSRALEMLGHRQLFCHPKLLGSKSLVDVLLLEQRAENVLSFV